MTATASPYASMAASELVQQEPASIPLGHQFIVPYGHAGRGKSSLASQFPNHIYLDLEGSAVQLGIRTLPPELAVKTWASFRELVTTWYEHGVPEGVDTLIIDTASKLYDMCCTTVRAENGWATSDDSKWGEWWTMPRKEFKRIIGLLRKMHEENRLGTVIVAHEINLTATEDGVDGTFPDAGDKRLHEFLAAEASLVMRAQIVTTDPITGTPYVNDKMRPEPKFVLQVRGDGDGIVKDRSDRLPAWVPNDYNRIAELYEAGGKNKGATA